MYFTAPIKSPLSNIGVAMGIHIRDHRGMKFIKSLLSILSLFIFASCSGIAPGLGVLAPASIAGYEMDATGLKGSYYYTFAADGSYSRDTVKPSGKISRDFTGRWKWNRTTPSTAILDLDADTVVSLKFTTHSHANATLKSTGDTMYPVEFTAPR